MTCNMSLSVIELDLPPSWVGQEESWSLGEMVLLESCCLSLGRFYPDLSLKMTWPAPRWTEVVVGDTVPAIRRNTNRSGVLREEGSNVSSWNPEPPAEWIGCVPSLHPCGSIPVTRVVLSKVQPLALTDQPWDASAKLNNQHWLCPTDCF